MASAQQNTHNKESGTVKTGAQIVIETLIAHEATTVFGFPGGAVLSIYDELYYNTDRITHYLTSHEQGAAHAADGYARATGKTGVVIATSGPGATNLVTGIATAYLDSVPMVAITGNVASHLMGKDSFQEVDITGITMPVTKHNYLVKRVEDLEHILYEAFQVARSGRPGPVLVDIPKNVQAAETVFVGGAPFEPLKTAKLSEEELLRAAELINSSKRPYIYGGGGVISANAAELLQDFAAHLDAPVGLSMMGLGAMDSSNPLFLGMTGMHGLPQSISMNAEADLIIGIGVRFSDRATGDTARYLEKAKILHIDIDDVEIDKNIYSTASVLGDLREVLPRLTAMIEKSDRSEWKARAEEVRKALSEAVIKGERAEGTTEAQALLTPYEIIQAVRAYADDDTVIATDVGQHQMWVAQHYRFSRPRTFLTSGGLGTMGFGLGAAIGASLGRGNKRTVLFTSDGSFHMNMSELATAVSHRLPIVIVILNNQALGMVRQWQTHFYGARYSQSTLERATDFVKLAEAFGATGYKVVDNEQLSAALEAAFKTTSAEGGSGPIVLDCRIDPNAKVLPIVPPGGFFDDAIMED